MKMKTLHFSKDIGMGICEICGKHPGNAVSKGILVCHECWFEHKRQFFKEKTPKWLREIVD